MSQHYFETKHEEKPVTVVMGWDRRLQGFFMVIEKANTEEDEYIYSNLSDEALFSYMGLPPSLDYFLEVLQSFGLKVPQTMIDEVRADGINNVGNRIEIYSSSVTEAGRVDH